jgi:hypothetical protein
MKKFKTVKRKPIVSETSTAHKKQLDLINKKLKEGEAFTRDDIEFITNWNLANPLKRIDVSIVRKPVTKKVEPTPKTLEEKISDLTHQFDNLSTQQIRILDMGIKSKIKKQEEYTKFDFAFINWKGDKYILELAHLKVSKWRKLEPFEAKVYVQWKKENKERRAKKKQLRKDFKIDVATFGTNIIPMLTKKFGNENIRQSKLGFTEIRKDDRLFRYYVDKQECEINKKVFPMPLEKFCHTFLKESLN